MKNTIIIGNRRIGKGFPVFVIAEISANHLQDFNKAKMLIRSAKKCGADAVKFQAYTPDTMTIDSEKKPFRIKHHTWKHKSLYKLYKKAYTPWDWFRRLKKEADDLGILFFATAFDKTAVDFLEKLNVPLHKIASFEMVDLPLIEYAAKTKKPLMLSTGMANLSEIKEAVQAAEYGGARDIVLLKCVSNYPAKPEEMNLRTIMDMKDRFRCPVGLSDHTLGIGVSIAAVSLGAQVIEKHLTLSRKIKTPDSFFSIEPPELKELVDNIRIAEKALGKVRYGSTKDEKDSRRFRRSLFVVEDINKNGMFTEKNIMSIRPAGGLHPKFLKEVLGKKAKKNIAKGAPLKQSFIRV
jgi:pseudaminic acid synthase